MPLAGCTTGGLRRTSNTSRPRRLQLVAQYNQYRPFSDLSVNGQQTLAENIADVAGLSAAYDAYHRSLRGKRAPTVQGLSADQQFFISFAQSWRTKTREPAVRNQILTDGHVSRPVPCVDGPEPGPLVRSLPGEARTDTLSRRRRTGFKSGSQSSPGTALTPYRDDRCAARALPSGR